MPPRPTESRIIQNGDKIHKVAMGIRSMSDIGVSAENTNNVRCLRTESEFGLSPTPPQQGLSLGFEEPTRCLVIYIFQIPSRYYS